MAACPSCGAEHVSSSSKFCHQCGAPLAKAAGGDPFVGRIIGSYQVLSVIGAGGMGKVYRAEQTKLHRPVCIKTLLPSLAADPLTVQRFEREGIATAAMRHPNIVSVFDFGRTDDGVLYIVMELVEGKTVRQLIKEEAPLPLGRALLLMNQVLGALDEAHANNVVHRDLKPSNLLVSKLRDGSDLVKVVDFGIAKLVSDAALGEGGHLTGTGMMIGTPGYMPPEQLLGQEVDARSDLYSAAVILWELLTGRKLFQLQTEGELAEAHIKQVPPSASSVSRMPLPPALDAAIFKALEKRPENRFKSALEFRAALEAIQGSVRGALPSATPVSAEVRPALPAPLTMTGVKSAPLTGLQGMVPEKLLTYATSLPSLAARRDKRPLVVGFVELIGLGALSARGPDSARATIATLVADLSACVTQASGHAEKVAGNCLVVVFGLPTIHEDDSMRCMRALAGMVGVVKHTAQQVGAAIGLRAGVHSDSVAGGGYDNLLEDPAVTDVLNVARRLAVSAETNQVRVTQTVQRLAASAFRFSERAPISGEHSKLATWELTGAVDDDAGDAEPLAGRVAELGSLRALTAQIAERKAGGALLVGGAGVGKTRLLREAERLAKAKGITVARARGGRFGVTAPFDVLRQLIHSLNGRPAPEGAAHSTLVGLSRFGVGGNDLTRLEKIFSALAPKPDEAGPLPEDAQLDRAVLMRVLLQAADTGPLMLVIDDLQLADRATVEVLEAIIGRAGQHPLGFIGATRPVGLETLLPGLRRIELAPLKAPEIAALVTQRFPAGKPSQELVAFILDRSEGNPLFARELVGSLLEHRSVKLEGGEWRLDGDVAGVPDSLAVLIAARLDRLNANSRLLLSYAVVAGRTFDVALIAAAVDTPLDVQAAVDECQQREVITPTEAPGCFTFSQVIVADAVAAALAPSVRKHIHQRLGEAVERGVSAGGEHPLEAMARHFRGAELNRKAFKYLRLSAERLLERHAHTQAAEAFQQCLTLAQADLPRAGAVPEAAAVQWLEVGAKAVEALAMARPREAVDLADKVLATAQGSQGPLARAEVLRQKALALVRQSRPQDAEALLKQAQGLVSGTTSNAIVAQLHADLATVLEARGQLTEASDELLIGFRLLGRKQAKERELVWQYLNQLGRIHLRLNKLEQAKEFFENARAQAKQVESAIGESKALVNMAVLSAQTKDPARALVLLSEANELAQRAGDHIGVQRIRYNRALVMRAQGDPAAKQELEGVVESARELGWREGEALAAQALGAQPRPSAPR